MWPRLGTSPSESRTFAVNPVRSDSYQTDFVLNRPFPVGTRRNVSDVYSGQTLLPSLQLIVVRSTHDG